CWGELGQPVGAAEGGRPDSFEDAGEDQDEPRHDEPFWPSCHLPGTAPSSGTRRSVVVRSCYVETASLEPADDRGRAPRFVSGAVSGQQVIASEDGSWSMSGCSLPERSVCDLPLKPVSVQVVTVALGPT